MDNLIAFKEEQEKQNIKENQNEMVEKYKRLKEIERILREHEEIKIKYDETV